MPWFKVDDAPESVRMLEPGTVGQLHSQVSRPVSEIAARLLNLRTPYLPLLAPATAEWPRATIRPFPLLDGPGHAWAVKLWTAQDVPLVERSRWVTATERNLADAVNWAAAEVDRRRTKRGPRA